MKKIIVIDNYDSFTYNLVHILRELGLGKQMRIVRNDQFELEEVAEYDQILLSPGPGVPRDAGLMPQVLQTYGNEKSILGVCLGHQAIGEAFGARLYNLPLVYHGVTTDITLGEKDDLFYGLPSSFTVCRYHSWVIEKETLPEELLITSEDPDGRVMSVRHKDLDIRGVQFHPESIMTQHGKKMIDNWIQLSTK
jgi:anthranilate synthase component 2